MSFTITIQNIPDKDLGPVLARLRLPRGATHDVAHKRDNTEVVEEPKDKRFMSKGDTRLTMTGRVPSKKGAKLKAALKIFEKLEVKQGIGTVSVDDFRGALEDRNMLFRLVHEDYMDYLR